MHHFQYHIRYDNRLSAHTKAPCGGELAGRSPVDRRTQGLKRSTAGDANGIPLATIAAPANRHVGATAGVNAGSAGGARSPPGGDHHSSGSSLRFAPDARAAGRAGAVRRDCRAGHASADGRLQTLAGRTHQRLTQYPQEAGRVHRAPGRGNRLLVRVLGHDRHSSSPRARRLDPIPLGRPPHPQTMIDLPIGASSEQTTPRLEQTF